MKQLYPEKLKLSSSRYNFFLSTPKTTKDRFICVKCKDILIEPQQSLCGCRYCYSCITALTAVKVCSCPGCGFLFKFEDNYMYDRAVEKEIFQMNIICLNENCKFESKFLDLKDHLKVCTFRDEICETCSDRYPAKDRYEHLNTYCKMIKIKCKDCGHEMTRGDYEGRHRNVGGDLLELCNCWKESCPFKCSVEVQENIKEHLRICPLLPVDCVMKAVGCTKLLTRTEMHDHMIQDVFDHMILMMTTMSCVHNSNAGIRMDLEENYVKMSSVIDSLKDAKVYLQTEISKETQKIERCKNNFCKLESEANVLRQIVTSGKIVAPSDLYGETTWIITGIEEKIKDAQNGVNLEIFSDSFYSGRPGYKLCLKVYPNGNGTGFGNSISLYFFLMKGEYDAELSWPFRRQILLSVINRESKRNRTMKMKPDENEQCYGRPVSQYNKAAGHPAFIGHSDLFNGFIENGSITVLGKLL